MNRITLNDWLLCVGLAIQGSILNGLEFACPSGRWGLHLFFKKKVESESPTLLLR